MNKAKPYPDIEPIIIITSSEPVIYGERDK
jgi:hypothetical protein